MKFSIVTLYDENRKDFGDLTSRVARDYSQAHGYKFTCHRHSLDPDMHPTWSKLIAVKKEMSGSGEWILWLDADALIVQPRIRLEDILLKSGDQSKDIYFSWDQEGLCTGVFLIKDTAWSKAFLEAAYLLGELPGCAHLHEQLTIKAMVENFPAVSERIGEISDSLIQNPQSDFSSDAFIMHYWAATSSFQRHHEKIMKICFHGWQRAFF